MRSGRDESARENLKYCGILVCFEPEDRMRWTEGKKEEKQTRVSSRENTSHRYAKGGSAIVEYIRMCIATDCSSITECPFY